MMQILVVDDDAGSRNALTTLLRERWIDERKRHAVEREVPRGVPRVLPLVGHRDDVRVVEMRPLAVPSVLAA